MKPKKTKLLSCDEGGGARLLRVKTTVHAQCEYTLKGIPTVIAHQGFIEVGCLKITNEAVERLYQIVQERKGHLVDRMYQKGNYTP